VGWIRRRKRWGGSEMSLVRVKRWGKRDGRGRGGNIQKRRAATCTHWSSDVGKGLRKRC